MELPAEVEKKFQTLLDRYPQKRSALVPMALYAQDALGCVTDEVIAEIARRLDLNTLQVTETLAYYSMIRRKPAGKYHVQVCTNVSCMLRGGNRSTSSSRKSWRSATRKPPPTACSRWKKSSASAPAPARRPCR